LSAVKIRTVDSDLSRYVVRIRIIIIIIITTRITTTTMATAMMAHATILSGT